MKDLEKRIVELERKLTDLKERIKYLELKWDIMNSEIIAVIDTLSAMSKTIERLDKIATSIHELTETIKKKKGIWL